MIGIDTNVLVRFLVQDDPRQGRQARSAFERMTAADPGYLTTLVLAETYWVLSRAYKLDPETVMSALEDVMAAEEVVVQDARQAAAAIDAARSGADFADALIAAECNDRGCRAVLSFDTRAQDTLGFTAPT